MFDQQVTDADRTSFFRVLVNANPDHLPTCAAVEDLLRGSGGERRAETLTKLQALDRTTWKWCVAANFPLPSSASMAASGKDLVGFRGAIGRTGRIERRSVPRSSWAFRDALSSVWRPQTLPTRVPRQGSDGRRAGGPLRSLRGSSRSGSLPFHLKLVSRLWRVYCAETSALSEDRYANARRPGWDCRLLRPAPGRLGTRRPAAMAPARQCRSGLREPQVFGASTSDGTANSCVSDKYTPSSHL